MKSSKVKLKDFESSIIANLRDKLSERQADLCDSIIGPLHAAHDDKAKKRLGFITVLETIHSALKNKKHYWSYGTTIEEGRGATVLALAAYNNESVFVMSGQCPSQKASPGRAWANLKPWRDNDLLPSKVMDWVDEVKPIQIHLSELSVVEDLIQKYRASISEEFRELVSNGICSFED